MHKYTYTEQQVCSQELGTYTTYGIKIGDSKTIDDISTDKTFVQDLVDLLNKEKVEPIHIINILEDIL